MTNETTASQPNSIGDDAQFQAMTAFMLRNEYYALVKLIDNFRAPAAQASATIQAAPEGFAAKVRAIAEKWNTTAISEGFAGNEVAYELLAALGDFDDAATIQEPVMVAEPDADELKFNAQRLRNVALLVGLAGAIPDDDATLDGARGAVLGMISGRLRGEAKIDALAAPMVADPAGVAFDREEFIRQVSVSVAEMDRDSPEGQPEMMLVTPDELQNTMRSVFDRFDEAATVKAVPSEALSRRVGVPDNMIQWAVRELLCALPERRDWLNPDAESVLRAEFQRAAPLSDKTGGGE